MSNNKSTERTRAWTIVLYPESAPSNWRDLIDDLHIEWVESPLHDKDLDGDGSPKKAHYHVLLYFGGVKTYEQVLNAVSPLNCPIPVRCHSTKALIRYMVHQDNPDKYQYSVSDIISHGGFDLEDAFRPSASQRYTLIAEMIQFIRDNDVREFLDMVVYATEYRFDDWFPLLCDNSAFLIEKVIRSNRHKPIQPNC